jgi:hypothetical protein
LYQKNYALCGNCLNFEFGLIQPFAPIEQRHRLLRYSEPDRLVVAAVQSMQQRLPGPMFLGPLVGERLHQAIAEQISIHFAIPIDTVTAAVRVIQQGLGDEVLVGRITLSDA